MRVALGTVEISDQERRLIAADLDFYGERQARGKLATRDEVREYLEDTLSERLQALKGLWDDEADDWL